MTSRASGGAQSPAPASGVGPEGAGSPEDATAPRQEPLHARLRRTAFVLACIPYPDRPLTDDQAAEVIAAAHLLMTASVRLEGVDERHSRHTAAQRRRTRFTVVALVGFAALYLLFVTVMITLDASH